MPGEGIGVKLSIEGSEPCGTRGLGRVWLAEGSGNFELGDFRV